MKHLKIAHRLYLIVGLSVLVMCILAVINWNVLSRLAELQDQGVTKAQLATRVHHDSNLGAQAYRVIADTYINRNFDEVSKKWVEINKEIDDSFTVVSAGADTAEKKAKLAEAKAAIQQIRTLYEGKYLELSRKNAPQSEMGETDDAVDKQIDRFDAAYNAIYQLVEKESEALDAEFDVASKTSRMWMGISILVGALAIVGVTQFVSRSITTQLGMELAEATVLAHKIASGDLTHSFETERSHQDSLARAFDHMLATLKSIVVNVRQGSETVAASSSEIAQGNHDLSNPHRATGQCTGANRSIDGRTRLPGGPECRPCARSQFTCHARIADGHVGWRGGRAGGRNHERH